jgi:hypothetical protein
MAFFPDRSRVERNRSGVLLSIMQSRVSELPAHGGRSACLEWPFLMGDHRSKEKQIQRRRSDMQSTTGFGTFCAMTLTAAGLLFMPAANAQQQSPSGPSVTAPSPTTTPANISDKKLDAAAAAVKKVSAVKGTFEQKLAQAPAAEKGRLVGEANNAMEKAVIDQGLSIEEYTTILQVAQKDPVVRDKLLQRMK